MCESCSTRKRCSGLPVSRNARTARPLASASATNEVHARSRVGGRVNRSALRAPPGWPLQPSSSEYRHFAGRVPRKPLPLRRPALVPVPDAVADRSDRRHDPEATARGAGELRASLAEPRTTQGSSQVRRRPPRRHPGGPMIRPVAVAQPIFVASGEGAGPAWMSIKADAAGTRRCHLKLDPFRRLSLGRTAQRSSRRARARRVVPSVRVRRASNPHAGALSLSATTPATMRPVAPRVVAFTGSLETAIPRKTAPAAPMPTKTA